MASLANGVVFCGSLVPARDITDGTSNTYLAGEKYVTPDIYTEPSHMARAKCGDNLSAYNGDSEDVDAAGPRNGLPMQDATGYFTSGLFGSAHASGFNMAFCDGSVQWISYSIDYQTHRSLGNRKDGLPIGGKGF